MEASTNVMLHTFLLGIRHNHRLAEQILGLHKGKTVTKRCGDKERKNA